jgi:hypothetical protein
VTQRIELPEGGQYIEVKDVSELNHGDERAVKGAVSVEINTKTGRSVMPGDYQEAMQDTLAARIITGWNLQWPLPKGDPAVLENLTRRQIKALYDGIEDHVNAINEVIDLADKDSDPTSGSAI